MDNNDDEIQCEVMWKLTQEKEYEEMVEHVLGACMKCITNPKKKFDGKELLYPDTPPPWITIPEAEKMNPHAWKKYEKKKVNVQMTPEEFDQFLVDSDFGDERIVYEIAKFKRIERPACWPYMREIRKKQREIALIKEKELKIKQKAELEAKREAEKLKKLDEKRKVEQARKTKSDEKQEYLDKINEVEKQLEDSDSNEEEADTPEAPTESTGPPEKQKTFNARADLPWCPSMFDLLCAETTSKMDQASQKRILAMCQNIMNRGELQHASNKRELKDIHKATEEEYDKLAAAALEHARKETIHPIDFIMEKTLKFTLNSFQRKNTSHQRYNIKNPIFTLKDVVVPSGIQTALAANPPVFEKLLRKPEWNDTLEVPEMKRKCLVQKNKHVPKLKVFITDDTVANRLIETQDTVTVMMDATTVCHLMTPNWEGKDYDYGIAVKVEERDVGGRKKRVVTLSKPTAYGSISKSAIQRKTLKRMLKHQFIKQSGQSSKVVSNSAQKSAAALEKKISEKRENAPAEATPETSTDVQSSSSHSILDSIMAGIQNTEKIGSQDQEKSDVPSLETGYQYGVFKVGDSRVLVRSRPPFAVNDLADPKRHLLSSFHHVSFEPRIEYLPNGGAMDLSDCEYMWNYSKKLFKMADAHILYRTHYTGNNVLQVDALTMQTQLAPAPPGTWGLISARTVQMEQLINQLGCLEVGEYLIYQEKEKPLVVVTKSKEPSSGVSTELLVITENDVTSLSETIQDGYFHGFSTDVVLQWQILQGRAPRMLMAQDSPMWKNLPSRGNLSKMQRKKQIVKRKRDEREDEKKFEKRQKMYDLDDPNLYADLTNQAVLHQDFDYQPKKHQFSAPRGRGRGRGGGDRRGGRGRGSRGRGRGGANSGGPSTSEL